MFENFYDVVSQVVKEWIPKEQYSTEDKYRDDLAEFLRLRLNRRQDLFGLGTSEKHLIQREAGRNLADIGIDGKIGIELKLNLAKKSQMDRLVGQVKGFLDDYSCVIVVLCGRVDPETLDVLQYKFREYAEPTFSIGEPQKVVKIVSKSSRSNENESKMTKDKNKTFYDTIFGT